MGDKEEGDWEKPEGKGKGKGGKGGKGDDEDAEYTSKKVLNTISRKEKVKEKEKDQKVKKEEKVKALRVMEKTPNTTLKEKVVEKVKVTGKEKTGDPKEEKEKN